MTIILPRPLRAAALVASTALALFACREEPQPSTTGGTDAAGTAPTARPSPDTSAPVRRIPETFEDFIYDEYASLALGVPRREQDSIIKSTPMSEIEAVMTKRLQRQDSIAREELAERHGITRDSVDAILAAKNVPTRR